MQQSTREIIVGQARRVFDLANRNEDLVIDPLRDATAQLQATLAEAAREERVEATSRQGEFGRVLRVDPGMPG